VKKAFIVTRQQNKNARRFAKRLRTILLNVSREEGQQKTNPNIYMSVDSLNSTIAIPYYSSPKKYVIEREYFGILSNIYVKLFYYGYTRVTVSWY